MKRATRRQTGKKFCLESGCKSHAQNKGYCRLHYISNWSVIKLDEKIKAERRLNAYVDGMAQRHPKDFLEKIKEGLESDDKFKETMDGMNLDEEPTNETEREFVERLGRIFKIDE